MHVKMNLMKPSVLSNCEADDDFHLMNDSLNNDKLVNLKDNENDSSSIDSFSSLSTNDDSQNNDEPANVTLEQCSNTYFGGYLGKKCVDKFKCRFCEILLLKNEDTKYFDENEYFIFCKNYDSNLNMNSYLHLKRPTDNLINFVTLAQNIIKKIVEKLPYKKKICAFLFKKIKRILHSIFTYNDSCKHHLDYLVTHLIHCKLLKDFNWTSKNIKKGKSEKNKNKLKIIKNM